MKTTLAIIAGFTVLMAAITNRVSVNVQTGTTHKTPEVGVVRGAYMASEYLQFKKEKGLTDLSMVAPASEKLLFKAFVEQKEKIKH